MRSSGEIGSKAAAVILAPVASAALACGASADIVPPAFAMPDAGSWHSVFPSGLDAGGPDAVAAPGSLVFWIVTLTNESGSAWSGFDIRLPESGDGFDVTFVPHFEPTILGGPWLGGIFTLGPTLDDASFDAASFDFEPLAPGASLELKVPVFNPNMSPVSYHLEIMAAPVPAPGAAAVLALAAGAACRRRRRACGETA